MLVKFLDNNERPVWVNPMHVRYLHAKGKGTIILLGGAMYLKVMATPEDVAEAISAAMPDQVVLVPDDEAAETSGE